MVDGREATWSCSLSVTLPSLAWVSARNISSKSWSASTSTSTPWLVSTPWLASTPWLGLVSIPVRRLAQAGTRSSALARSVCRLARAGRLCVMSHIIFTSLGTNRLREYRE